jgi:integrase
MLRPGEMRLGQWCEIDWDEAIWHIPAERTKLRRPHDVPLTRQALALLRDLHSLTGNLDCMFRGQGKTGPISENTLNLAYRRMGFAASEVSAHGFRTTASTFLNETGTWQPDAIEKALAHGASNAVRGIYNRSTYWQERILMMQWWSDYLDILTSGAMILPFDAKAAQSSRR